MTRPALLAIVFAALVAVGVGCDRTYQDFTPSERRHGASSVVAEQPAGVNPGAISGLVVWSEDPPDVPTIRGVIGTPEGPRWGDVPNHFAPRIDPHTRGLADAVVYLKKAPNTTGFPPLLIEQVDSRVQVRQGERVSRIGFVKVGGEIEMVSRDEVYHTLRARGAAFFTLPFPEPNKALNRTFDTPGRVEFTSAAGYFWSAADVFVCDHGYYTLTGADGRFKLDQVPPGEYELVAWVRNWKVLGRDRDPETGKIVRLQFDEPFEIVRKVTVTGGKMTDVEFAFPPTK